MPVAVCKLLIYKGQYSTCHIRVPDVDTKLPAIKVDSQYYSFFRRLDDAEAVMKMLHRLAKKGEELALTKLGSSGYVTWALEAEGQELRGPRKKELDWPTHGPAPCSVLGDAQHYQQCYVQVPDVVQPMVAIRYKDDFYSVYQPGLEALQALDLATQFTWRGNQCAIAATPKGYAVCLWEPEASLSASVIQ